MDLPMESSKEYIWCTKLSNQQKSTQWEGRDDGGMEQLVLKRACLGVKAKEGERNLVEVVSFNHQQEKVQVCICSLRSGKQEDVGLSDLTIVPPAIFKLIEGSGPVHLVGNHMLMEVDEDEDDSEVEDLSDDEEIEEKIEAAKTAISMTKGAGKNAKANGYQRGAKKQADFDDDEEEDADDEDDDFDSDEESEEEEEKIPEPKPVAKKRKQTMEQEVNKKSDTETPKKKKKEAETPSKEKTPKTPLQQKENKTPQSTKATPTKTYDTIDEVKSAIKKFPGGKPKKEDKFCNWVRHSFKVKDDEWVKELWKSHKREMGL